MTYREFIRHLMYAVEDLDDEASICIIDIEKENVVTTLKRDIPISYVGNRGAVCIEQTSIDIAEEKRA